MCMKEVVIWLIAFRLSIMVKFRYFLDYKQNRIVILAYDYGYLLLSFILTHVL